MQVLQFQIIVIEHQYLLPDIGNTIGPQVFEEGNPAIRGESGSTPEGSISIAMLLIFNKNFDIIYT